MPATAPSTMAASDSPASATSTAPTPPTTPATTVGRSFMVGTSRTRKQSGMAKSSGISSGIFVPTSAPMIVITCQVSHRGTATPR